MDPLTPTLSPLQGTRGKRQGAPETWKLTPYDAAFLPLFVGLIALAWILLAAGVLSPWRGYLVHDWTRLGALATLCRVDPALGPWAGAAIAAFGWVLMSAAMMLPSTLTLLASFGGLAARYDRGHRLVFLLIVGYLFAWLVFGLLAHGIGLALATLAGGSPWLAVNGWAIAAAILLASGLFQFSALKFHCLDACRSPVSFILERWSGRHPARDSLWIGLAQGTCCVGCCWALMLVMFALGTGNLAWMLALAAVMGLEKNSPWGRRLSRPLGALLIAGSLALAGAGLGVFA
jgi:predicted metal-binding membrane protein